MTKGFSPTHFFVHKVFKNISKSVRVINMTSWMRNTISKLYNAVSAPVAAARNALTERLQSVRETASLLCNRMVDNIGYEREKLKDIIEKEPEEEEAKEQQQDDDDEEYDATLKIKLVYEG